MTLFVRQMGDILLLDGIEPFKIEVIQNKNEEGIFFKLNAWMSK